MDKRPTYPGAIPLDLDILQPQRNVEIAIGYIMRAAFGANTTVIDGLTVAQQASPNMTVQVGPGCYITQSTIDTVASGFGSLTFDGSTPLVKIGINKSPTNMSALTAPPTAGQSQNWLVQASFLEADGSPVVLPYYNASNPAIPYTGPANAGTTNNTGRTNTVQLQWKGGTPATTGQQNTPTPDAGWVGVAIVTVANGQSTITNSNITPYSAAPYVPTKLPLQRTKLTANLNIYVSTFGNDTNNSGLSVSSPFLTLQKAWTYIVSSLDLSGFSVTVNVANGTYSTGLVVAAGQPVGLGTGNLITFLGNTGSPSSVIISGGAGACFLASTGASFRISGMTLTGTGIGVGAGAGGSISVGSAVVFGSMTGGEHIYTNGGTISLDASYTISGGAAYHWQASRPGSQIAPSVNITITLTGTPAFSSAFAVGQDLGYIAMPSGQVTFSGAATGSRYASVNNSVIDTNGGGASFFPGNSAGSAVTGLYV